MYLLPFKPWFPVFFYIFSVFPFCFGWMISFILCLCPLLFHFSKCIFGFDLQLPTFSHMWSPFPYLLALTWQSYRLKDIHSKNRIYMFLHSFPTFSNFDVPVFNIFMYILFAASCIHVSLKIVLFFLLVLYTGLFDWLISNFDVFHPISSFIFLCRGPLSLFLLERV